MQFDTIVVWDLKREKPVTIFQTDFDPERHERRENLTDPRRPAIAQANLSGDAASARPDGPVANAIDAEAQAARDAARDAQRDAERDPVRDAERDAKRDEERDAKRDAERDEQFAAALLKLRDEQVGPLGDDAQTGNTQGGAPPPPAEGAGSGPEGGGQG